MQTVLDNGKLKVTIQWLGAELSGIMKKESGREYLWNADERYWKRISPVLFPFVGKTKNLEYLYEGKTYPMEQHGFARDMNFSFMEDKARENEAWFSLSETERTLKIYPFCFCLEIGYRLEENKVRVMWRVKNTDHKTLPFSIGGHPAFLCPLNENEKQTECFFLFDKKEPILYSQLGDSGLVEKDDLVLETENGQKVIDAHLFDRDALIVEGNQVKEVSLCGADQKPYVTVRFDAPLFGLWSPAKKNAPFVCIEPWYGRCDRKEFSGTIMEREYGNLLEPGEAFEASYEIEIV